MTGQHLREIETLAEQWVVDGDATLRLAGHSVQTLLARLRAAEADLQAARRSQFMLSDLVARSAGMMSDMMDRARAPGDAEAGVRGLQHTSAYDELDAAVGNELDVSPPATDFPVGSL